MPEQAVRRGEGIAGDDAAHLVGPGVDVTAATGPR